MKAKYRWMFPLLLALILTVGVTGVLAQSPLGTEFTYQGELQDGGNPADGVYDFEFTLYDAASGGAQIGSTVIRDDVTVSDGRFTVQLDFGSDVFSGDARWLEIRVKADSAGSYTLLTPRQPLTPTPYAQFAGSGPFWALTGNSGTSSTVNFLGTTDPMTLTVAVSDTTALRIVPAEHTPSLVGGSHFNRIGSDLDGATIGGGGNSVLPNEATRDYATVGGGQGNTASGFNATIGGGHGNSATDGEATVGGGIANNATGNESTIAGGFQNFASARNSTIGGGGYNTASGEFSTVGGGRDNVAGADFATIAGGGPSTGDPSLHNEVFDEYGTIGGGGDNVAGSDDGNPASARYATVAGGDGNEARAFGGTIGGGGFNVADGPGYATVGGGQANTAGGHWATVPGGSENQALGAHSFAAGYYARAQHAGTFVWGDDTSAPIYSGDNDQFIVRANGGIWFGTASTTYTPTIGLGVFISTSTGAHLTTGGAWTNASDRANKENFVDVDGQAVLEQLAALPIQSWNYTAEGEDVRHVGPVAQDFYAAFGLGHSETTISTVDADGVALVAIQGLYELIQQQEAEIDALQEENADLQAQIDELTARLDALEQHLEDE